MVNERLLEVVAMECDEWPCRRTVSASRLGVRSGRTIGDQLVELYTFWLIALTENQSVDWYKRSK